MKVSSVLRSNPYQILLIPFLLQSITNANLGPSRTFALTPAPVLASARSTLVNASPSEKYRTLKPVIVDASVFPKTDSPSSQVNETRTTDFPKPASLYHDDQENHGATTIIPEVEDPDKPEERTVDLFLNITRQALNTTKAHLLENNFTLFGHDVSFVPVEEDEEARRIQRLLEVILADEFGGDDGNDNSEENVKDAPSSPPAQENETTATPILRAGLRQNRAKHNTKSPSRYHVQKTSKVAPHNKGKRQKQSEEERIARYNGYVDAILKRMNTLIRTKRMDPLRVNLFAGSGSANGSGPPTPAPLKPPKKETKDNRHRNKAKGGSSTKGSSTKGSSTKGSSTKGSSTKGSSTKGSSTKGSTSTKQKNKQKGQKPNDRDKKKKKGNPQRQNLRRGKQPRPGRQGRDMAETVLVSPTATELTETMPPTAAYTQQEHPGPFLVTFAAAHSSQLSPSSETRRRERVVTPMTARPANDPQEDASEGKGLKSGGVSRPVRGVLHGLSTIRRSGPVKVIKRAQNTRIVKAKFLLGPVALDILPKKTTNASSRNSNIPTATATAKALKGIIEISLQKGGGTKIRKLRVHPPSSVKFDGDGNKVKKQGYRKLGPVASQRLLIVANQVLRQARDQKTNSTA